MVVGLVVAAGYMALTQPWLREHLGLGGPVQLWWDMPPIAAGVFGVPAGC